MERWQPGGRVEREASGLRGRKTVPGPQTLSPRPTPPFSSRQTHAHKHTLTCDASQRRPAGCVRDASRPRAAKGAETARAVAAALRPSTALATVVVSVHAGAACVGMRSEAREREAARRVAASARMAFEGVGATPSGACVEQQEVEETGQHVRTHASRRTHGGFCGRGEWWGSRLESTNAACEKKKKNGPTTKQKARYAPPHAPRAAPARPCAPSTPCSACCPSPAAARRASTQQRRRVAGRSGGQRQVDRHAAGVQEPAAGESGRECVVCEFKWRSEREGRRRRLVFVRFLPASRLSHLAAVRP